MWSNNKVRIRKIEINFRVKGWKTLKLTLVQMKRVQNNQVRVLGNGEPLKLLKDLNMIYLSTQVPPEILISK